MRESLGVLDLMSDVNLHRNMQMNRRVDEYRYADIKTKNWGKVGAQICNELAR